MLGLVLARVILAVNARINDLATAVVFQFCQTFAVWILAEQVHLSGIITIVVFAMAASRRAPEMMPADGTIGDAAFQRLEEELDWAELGWAQVLPQDRP